MFVKYHQTRNTVPKTINLYEVSSLVFQHLTMFFSLSLFFIFILTIILVKLNLDTKKFTILFSSIKVFNLVILSLMLCLVFLKFFIELYTYKDFSAFLNDKYLRPFSVNFYFFSTVMYLNGSILSDTIILLAFSSGIVCLYLLGEKNLNKYLSNLSIFSIFIVAITFMVYTTNLLVMFLGFEMLFVPTIYFVYSHGYVQRTDKTIKILLYWTLCGAFLVFTALGYLFFKYKTLSYYSLASLNFSKLERGMLYFCIFIGFGVKVPVFPFHYWLTKIHVEAPAGFSIFLSGFLVKAAIYCFYFFSIIFHCKIFTTFSCMVSLLGLVDASVKMWTQTDFKKLIAFATIQEMNLILFLLLSYQNFLDYGVIVFILIHGWLSTLMFFLVDVIQKKTSSRNILEISGLAYNFKELRFFAWLILILFSGFPLTVKFLIEWEVLAHMILHAHIVFIPILMVVIVFGIVGFAKQMIIILYGLPRRNKKISYNLSKRDKHLMSIISLILIILNLIHFWLG